MSKAETKREALDERSHLEFVEVSDRDRRRLYNQSLLASIAGLTAVVWTSPLDLSIPFFLGILICTISVAPLLHWARHMPYNYPFFEIFLATHATSYGIPLISEHQHIEAFDEAIRIRTAWGVLLFQVCALATFYGLRIKPKTSGFWAKSIFRNPSPKWLVVGLVFSATYTVVTTFYFFPDAEYVGVMRAVTLGIATACTFMLCLLWGRGRLTPRDQGLTITCLAIHFAIWGLSLVLRQGASLVLLGLVGYFLGRRRIPWVAVIACFSIFAVLNQGKYKLRGEYWFEGTRQGPQLIEIPAFYLEWFQAGFTPREGEEQRSTAGTLLERSSLFHMLSLVVTLSPEHKPFLNGETYVHVIGQLVPRPLWPDKPRGHISTYTLAIYYGLQDEHATQSTTIAFGFLPEAYANFGVLGLAGLGLVMGAGYKLITGWSRLSPLLSYAGLIVVMITAWSFQAELTMSIWLTSLFQAVAATVGAIYVPRRILGLDHG